MSWKRWAFTALSFAVTFGISGYFIVRWWRAGGAVELPLRSHLLALTAVAIEIFTRSWKVTWSAKAVRIRLPFMTALRTTLAGDFGASLTPARTGAEPARYLVLAEAGVPPSSALVVLYAELFLEMLSLATVIAVVAVVFRHAGFVLDALVAFVGTYAAVILGVAAVAVMLARHPAQADPPAWARRLWINERRWPAVERWLGQVRMTVEAMRTIDLRWASASYLASVAHVTMRLCVLPALVLGAGAHVPLAPLALWPLGLLYGAAIVPAPGGGGAVELAFTAALSTTIGPELFAAALLWWRFYTFYLYIVIGGLAAGRTVMRALAKTEQIEKELEHGEPAKPAS
jgi:hypothetical protein